jgi:Xaa-Pro aminopeptidase
MGYERANIGTVGYGSALASDSIGYNTYAQLLQGLPNCRISNQTALVEELRCIKSPEEIRMLEKSGEIAKLCLDTLIERARPGVRECEVWADMMRTQVVNGGEPHVFNWISSASIVDGAAVDKRLLHGNPPPASPTTRKLQKADLLICEYHASYAGYLTAVEFTLFVGEAPQPLVDLHRVAVECLEGGLAMFRPGVLLKQVAEAMRAPVVKAGYDYIELGFHGHGLASPEFPTIVHKPVTAAGLYGNMAAAVENVELRPGMVFGTNIDIHNPKWKRDSGIMFGDTILVTEGEARLLVGVPTELPCNR